MRKWLDCFGIPRNDGQKKDVQDFYKTKVGVFRGEFAKTPMKSTMKSTKKLHLTRNRCAVRERNGA